MVAILLYDFPNISSLADYIGSQLSLQNNSLPPAVDKPCKTTFQQEHRFETSLIRRVDHNTLADVFADVLQLSAPNLDPDTSFIDLGLDSISGVEIVRHINRRFGLSLDAVVLYDYHTLDMLAVLINEQSILQADTLQQIQQAPQSTQSELSPPLDIPAEKLKPVGLTPLTQENSPPKQPAPADQVAAPPPPQAITQTSATSAPQANLNNVCQDIAVIGMSGRFPDADDIDTLWQNLCAGKNSVTEVPQRKWSLDTGFSTDKNAPGKSYSKWMASLADEDKFDALFFNISPREAERMDPQQRLLLEEAWKALENAGECGDALSDTPTGVFVGMFQGDYLKHAGDDALDSHVFTGIAPSICAARLSYLLNLQGPALSIDTACSSSLVAIHQACQSLRQGECSLALAGGVYIMTTSEMHVMTSKAEMLSERGRCATFDDQADGIVLGEAVGMLVLKPLAQAEADGDRIYGVIKGSGVNQDGKTNGITAPSAASQARFHS